MHSPVLIKPIVGRELVAIMISKSSHSRPLKGVSALLKHAFRVAIEAGASDEDFRNCSRLTSSSTLLTRAVNGERDVVNIIGSRGEARRSDPLHARSLRFQTNHPLLERNAGASHSKPQQSWSRVMTL